MTNPNETMQPSRPRDAFRIVARTAALAGLAAALLVAPMTGCGQEEEAPSRSHRRRHRRHRRRRHPR